MRTKKPLILCVVVILLAGMIAVGHVLKDDSWVLWGNWGLVFPKDAECTQIYKKTSEPSFHGDGIRYHVFRCKNADAMQTAFEWKEISDESIETIESWLESIEVPPERRTDFSKCVYEYRSQQDGSELFLLWNSQNSEIYVVESFL